MICLDRAFEFVRNVHVLAAAAAAAAAVVVVVVDDVAAVLGNAAVIKFDSGFEVWVYQVRSSEISVKTSELVVLFAPSGVVKKIRIRPPV